MAQPLVRDLVRWHVDPPTIGSRLWRGALVVLWFVLLVPLVLVYLVSLLSWQGDPGGDYFPWPKRRDPRMPPPGGEMPCSRTRLTGRAPFLPAEGVSRHRVTATTDVAQVTVGKTRVPLPLDQLQVVSADCTSGWSLATNAPWVVRVIGPGTDLTFTGTRLALAWLAQLGGWPADR